MLGERETRELEVLDIRSSLSSPLLCFELLHLLDGNREITKTYYEHRLDSIPVLLSLLLCCAGRALSASPRCSWWVIRKQP